MARRKRRRPTPKQLPVRYTQTQGFPERPPNLFQLVHQGLEVAVGSTQIAAAQEPMSAPVQGMMSGLSELGVAIVAAARVLVDGLASPELTAARLAGLPAVGLGALATPGTISAGDAAACWLLDSGVNALLGGELDSGHPRGIAALRSEIVAAAGNDAGPLFDEVVTSVVSAYAYHTPMRRALGIDPALRLTDLPVAATERVRRGHGWTAVRAFTAAVRLGTWLAAADLLPDMPEQPTVLPAPEPSVSPVADEKVVALPRHRSRELSPPYPWPLRASGLWAALPRAGCWLYCAAQAGYAPYLVRGLGGRDADAWAGDELLADSPAWAPARPTAGDRARRQRLTVQIAARLGVPPPVTLGDVAHLLTVAELIAPDGRDDWAAVEDPRLPVWPAGLAEELAGLAESGRWADRLLDRAGLAFSPLVALDVYEYDDPTTAREVMRELTAHGLIDVTEPDADTLWIRVNVAAAAATGLLPWWRWLTWAARGIAPGYTGFVGLASSEDEARALLGVTTLQLMLMLGTDDPDEVSLDRFASPTGAAGAPLRGSTAPLARGSAALTVNASAAVDVALGDPTAGPATPFGAPLTFSGELALAARLCARTGRPVKKPEQLAEHAEHLDPALTGMLERRAALVAGTYRWPTGREVLTDAVPGDAAAIPYLAAQATTDALAAAYGAAGWDAVTGHGLVQSALPLVGAVRTTLGAAPFFLPADVCAGLLGSVPPDEELVSDIRLPHPACTVTFGAPFRLAPRSGLWDPAVAAALSFGYPGDVVGAAAERTGILERLPVPPMEMVTAQVPLLAAAYTGGAIVEGVVLLAGDEGQLAGELIWCVAVPDPRREDRVLGRALVPGVLDRAELADEALNVAATLAWAQWPDPRDAGVTAIDDLPLAEILHPPRRGAFRRAERGGALARVRVLDLTPLRVPDGPVVARERGEPTGRGVTAHMRRRHWRRVRVGPRDNWTYRGVLIEPTLVHGTGAPTGSARVYVVPERTRRTDG